MHCDSLRELCIRWCEQLVGIVQRRHIKSKMDFPRHIETSRQGMSQRGLTPLGQEGAWWVERQAASPMWLIIWT